MADTDLCAAGMQSFCIPLWRICQQAGGRSNTWITSRDDLLKVHCGLRGRNVKFVLCRGKIRVAALMGRTAWLFIYHCVVCPVFDLSFSL